jgi:pheromone shutdown-related protein TraB
MKEISDLEPGVTLVQVNNKKVYLVGTAHVSQASTELVEAAIRRFGPDSVGIEVCASRAQVLRNPELWKNTDIFLILRQGKAYLLLAQLLLSSFQKRIAKQLNVTPGQEMLTAIRVAEELGRPVMNIDRDVKITLRRIWATASLSSTLKATAAVITALFSAADVSEAEIEQLKSGDALCEILSEFSAYLPGIKAVLIDERDKYMAQKIMESPGKTVLAVVGAGHVAGLKEALGEDVNLGDLEAVPPKGKLAGTIGWTISAALICMFIYGFVYAGKQTSIQMLSAWVYATGGFAALGAALALPHPLTVACAFVSAPITCLHPAIAVGWVCALVEAMLRKPRVGDLENLAQDTTSLRGFWNNRVSKVLLVLVLANLGGALGTIVGGFKAASLLR